MPYPYFRSIFLNSVKVRKNFYGMLVYSFCLCIFYSNPLFHTQNFKQIIFICFYSFSVVVYMYIVYMCNIKTIYYVTFLILRITLFYKLKALKCKRKMHTLSVVWLKSRHAGLWSIKQVKCIILFCTSFVHFVITWVVIAVL